MSRFEQIVSVTFIDDASGQIIATSEMPPENLPDSFERDTTLHLGDENWSVVDAQPLTKSEFVNSGELTLRLRKVELVDPKEISFSQLDITRHFDDNLDLSVDDWIDTQPLNATIEEPESAGLPSPQATPEEVYRIASAMSQFRESVPVANDGVYCPICHIANIDLAKLRTPCPQCGRDLLKFGWD
ncbi:MAG: hypothetical protein R3C18_07950 [Planctomycetaceae bacterium]